MATQIPPLHGEPLSVEFANTLFSYRGTELDGLTTAGDLAGWLGRMRERLPFAAASQLTPTERDVRSARALRDAIRTLFTCAATDQMLDTTCVTTLNAAARAAPSWPELTLTPQPTSVLHTESAPAAAALGSIARDAVQLLSAPLTGVLWQCGAPGCILFYRKHHARQACCSPRCSNRTRARRHYAKRNTNAAPSGPQPQHREQVV